MRQDFVSELVKEALGPRGGPREVLASNPLGEYITGVLAPQSLAASHLPNVDSDAVLPSDSEGGSEDSVDAVEDIGALGISELSPQERPRSIGISFVIASRQASKDRFPDTRHRLNICVTWARYERHGPDRSTAVWIRTPKGSVLNDVVAQASEIWLDGTGLRVQDRDDAAEISVHLLTRPTPVAGNTVVSLYVVNRLRVPPNGIASAELHVFQPQLRVVAGQGAAIVPGIEGQPRSDEERELRYLYRKRPVLARGHLCSATWRSIDPERTSVRNPEEGHKRASGIPFAWVDRDALRPADANDFVLPDVRTEFVPTYPILTPSFDIPTPGLEPTLDAEQLARCWEPRRIRDALMPIAERYSAWIDERQGDADETTDDEERVIAQRLVSKCREAAVRIKGGIEVLERDDDIRLAFCFSMRAVALQHAWPAARNFVWRPFQIAFILLALESVANPASSDRELADLLWVSTGGGKTEAYLALAAFAIAYRRRQALVRSIDSRLDRTGAGVAVITRYTLRLLTIQQFRRTLKLVTACECLRVEGLGTPGPVGWRPPTYPGTVDFLWGSTRFSVGLWVGGDVTPNRLSDVRSPGNFVPGAITLLERSVAGGEPAQVIRCPACDAVLSIPLRDDGGLPAGNYELHLALRGPIATSSKIASLSAGALQVTSVRTAAASVAESILTLSLSASAPVSAEDVDQLWNAAVLLLPGASLLAARASRPGYFFRTYRSKVGSKRYDFDIYCPNPNCALVRSWCEGAPAGCNHDVRAGATGPISGIPGIPSLADGNRLCHVMSPFQARSPFLGSRVPITAYTVDEQVYERCPSIIVATVDKFARPAFEPRAASLFGNVEFHHCMYGYYRPFQTYQQTDAAGHPSPSGGQGAPHSTPVPRLDSPTLILQDELHLIEGPLGSLVGIYETAVDALARNGSGQPVKYIASTATVRQAEDQVRSVFNRELATFPPPGLTADNSFFLRQGDAHPLDDTPPGRLYVGLCAPGRGPLTPLVRIWARLLQSVWDERQLKGDSESLDSYWTLTGYFNAVRELAGARALYRQDIPERLRYLAGASARPIPDDCSQELSGRMTSTELPVVLDLLNQPFGQDALFTTAMFGTGVDVLRLALMVVNGQPKTTSAYVQSTGRVGRSRGALVAVFLRASRPRDLNHYEFFSGYHAQLHRFVEPVTVMPFAPGALERAAGPVGVLWLRNAVQEGVSWDQNNDARRMRTERRRSRRIDSLPALLEMRALEQPISRRPAAGTVAALVSRGLDEWERVAKTNAQTLQFVEYAIAAPPQFPVVLGDAAHLYARLDVVYRNAPSSLREIEETCGFQT